MKKINSKNAISRILLVLGLTSIATISYGFPKIRIELTGNEDLTFRITKARIVTHAKHDTHWENQQLATKICEAKQLTQETRKTTLNVSDCQAGQTGEPEGGYIELEFSQKGKELGNQQIIGKGTIVIKPEINTSPDLQIGPYTITSSVNKDMTKEQTQDQAGENPEYIIKMNAA